MLPADTAPDVESALARTRRARRVDRALAVRYPDAHCELDFTSPFELLVATVLSAQTTDVRVNLTTPILFARYPDAEALAAANPEEVEEILRPTGFFRAKTKAVMGLSQELVDRFHGEVPGRLKDLVTLPGVGRKTANVVLGNAFGVPGITTDTHVMRLSLRLGYTTITIGVLGFLGLGLPPPTPDWGGMVSQSYSMISTAPHMSLFPCIAISSLVIGFNLLADGLREISMRD